MVRVVFVAPFFMRATLQFVAGAAALPGVKLIVVATDHADKLPPGLRAKIASVVHLDNCLDVEALKRTVAAIQKEEGKVHRLIGTLEQLQVPLAQVRDALGIEGIGAEIALNFRDKSRMKSVLRGSGIPCAKHCLAVTASQAEGFAEEVGFPLVVKPPAGAGSRDTFQINTLENLREYLGSVRLSQHNPLLLEEFIMGNEFTFDSVLIDGKLVWHSITRYFPTPLQVLKNPWIQWCVLLPREIDHPHFDDIRKVAVSGLHALGLRTGLSHMEWFRRTDGSIAVSEVGARPPGGQVTSLHGFAHDFDIHEAWARLMVFGEFKKQERKFAAGAAFLRGQGQGRVRAVYGLDKIRQELGNLIVEAKLPQVGQPASGTYEGEGYILLRHPRTSVIEKALYRIITGIRVELG